MAVDLDPTALLELVADSAPESEPPLAAVLTGGRRLERRRRGFLAGAVLAAVAAVVVGALVMSSWLPERRPTPAPLAPPNSRMTPHQVFAWGEQLPRGDDAQVAYVVSGHILVAGDRRVDLGPGVQAELRAPMPGGWLAQVGGTDERGNWVHVRDGVLAEDGSFRPFTFSAARGTAQARSRGEAVSPDGSQVVYDGTIVDAATGEPLESLPGKPVVVTAWTALGIEYVEGPDFTPTVWTPGAPPRRYPQADEWQAPDLLLSYGDRCTRILALGPDGDVSRVTHLCGTGLAAASVDGHLVTTAGRVLDSRGRTLAELHLPIPPPSDVDGLRVDCCSLGWEDADTLLITLHDQTSFGEVRHLFVRCDIGEAGELTCQRASDVFADAQFPFTQPLPG